MKDCADWLEYQLYSDGSKKLTNANFCRVRLCPICSWRRGLKIFSQTSLIMNKLQQVKSFNGVNKYAYLFLTLTARNCTGDKLNKHLNDFFSAWNNFSRLKAFKSSVLNMYFVNQLSRLERDVLECEHNARHRKHDSIDYLDLMLSEERLKAFNEFVKDIKALLNISEENGI